MSKDLRKLIVDRIDSEFGRGSTLSLTDIPDSGVSEFISTGSMAINAAIHRPGIPIGMLTTIQGKPAAGKTTLATSIIKCVQQQGGLAILIDTEHTYDPERARRMGVENGDVIFLQDMCLEDAFTTVYRACDTAIKRGSPQPILTILDSHSSTATKAEVGYVPKEGDKEGVKKSEVEDASSRGEVGSSARITSLNLRRLMSSGMLVNARMALVFICQLKQDISFGFGPKDTFLAKNPIMYHSNVVLRMARKKTLGPDEGIRAIIKVVKNKVGPSFSECEVDITADGIDESGVLFDVAVEHNIIAVKGGGWCTMDGERFKKRLWSKILEGKPDLQRTLWGYMTGKLGDEK